VLILDEPTSGLDPMQRLEVRGLIQGLSAQHTVLLSSHILPEIEAVCRRVIIVDKGRIRADGTPDELVTRLAGASHVRVEAMVGHDVEAALRVLRSIRGVSAVNDRGRLGIHHQFELTCDEDLREDVGAIAAARGWALRELSWRRPTLEQIFARIASGASDEDVKPSAANPRSVSVTSMPGLDAPVQISIGGMVPVGGPKSAPSTAVGAGPAPARVVYNLNPFDRGASRSLSTPKAVEDPDRDTPGAPSA